MTKRRTRGRAYSGSIVERSGQGHPAGDHSDVAERLREVADEVSRRWIDLLGQQPDGAGPPTQRGVELCSLVDPALLREVLHEPEAAEQERAFITCDPVRRLLGHVPVHQTIYSAE